MLACVSDDVIPSNIMSKNYSVFTANNTIWNLPRCPSRYIPESELNYNTNYIHHTNSLHTHSLNWNNYNNNYNNNQWGMAITLTLTIVTSKKHHKT